MSILRHAAVKPLQRAQSLRAFASQSTSFKLPSLPYAYDALEPYIDARTMEIHHTKHHQTYVNNLNGVLNGENGSFISNKTITDIQKETSLLPKTIQTTVRNNGGGVANHNLFWTMMTKPGGNIKSEPGGDLKNGIEKTFQTVDNMKNQFNTAAATRFGSGWAWLCVNADIKEMFITSTPNQDNPLMKGIVDKEGTPILGLDVWEHSYYLKYQNRRPEYINAFWSVVNWEKVADNYNRAMKGESAVFD